MQESNQSSDPPDRPKISGVLLLIAVLLLLQFVRYLGQLEVTLNPTEDANIWRAFNSLHGRQMQGLWRMFLYYQLFVQIVIAFSSAIVALLLIARHRLFPRLFQAFLLIQMLLALGDWLLARQLQADYATQSLRTVIYSAVILALGLVYIHESERVKLVFSAQGDIDKAQNTVFY